MKMTDQEKLQVAVAKDVLKWIKPGKVKADGNGFVVNRSNGSCKLLQGADSKKIAKTLQKKCEVCAKGALFLSLVGMKNLYDFSKVKHLGASDQYGGTISLDYGSLEGRLSDVYPKEQLNLIENAFEVNEYDFEDARSMPKKERGDYERALIFGFKYKRDITRLRKIMENIIQNKGTFIP